MALTRRHLWIGTAAVTVVVGAGIVVFTTDMLGRGRPGDGPSIADLTVPGPLGDKVLGSADAPVTIIEYASMTCSHCAHFAAETFPVLKSRYIDTGKVRYILREFPLDPLAEAGFMLARCAGDNKFFDFVEYLFLTQANWAFVRTDPMEALLNVVKQAGFTKQSFDTCLANHQMLDAIDWVRERGAQTLKVNSTPTFFINGKMERGDIPIDKLEALIEPYLKAS